MSEKSVQFRAVYSVHINYSSIIYDDKNFVRLHKSETFHLDYDFLLTFVKTYLLSMIIGATCAIFLFSFLPNIMQVMAKGYQSHVIVDFAIDHMIKDYTPKISAAQDIPKAWFIPMVGIVFAAALRKFFVSD
jgi:hypothetical protein